MTIPPAKISDWTLEAFCAMQHQQNSLTNGQDYLALHPTSIDFLKNLDLPSKHPFCTNPEHTLLHPMSPPMGPSSDFEASTIWDAIVTAFLYHVPPATALAYLNAVLVAIYIAPMGLLVYLMRLFSLSRSDNSCKANASWKFQTELLFHSTLFFAWLVMTDDQYVMGIGRGFGAGLVGVLLVVAAAVAVLARDLSQPMFLHRVLLVLFVSSLVSPWGLLDADEIRTNVEPGLYYNHDNVLIRQTVDRWKTTLPDYASIATPWQWTGDARTGLPYLMNHPKAPNFHRVWLDTIDNEYVALDIAFPRGGHNTSNPLYLILHGLNGGSKEGYVLDLAASRTNAGSTVVVLVARGLMNTPIQGWTTFNAIRVSDAHSAALALRERVLQANQTLAGVGYSMGAIVLNRYVSTEKNVALDVSVSISGALCSIYQKEFHRSMKTWQRVITGHMKEMFFQGKWGKRLFHFLGHDNYQSLLRAQNIVETDYFAGALYNGYESLSEFYAEMSSILPCTKGESAMEYCKANNITRRRIPIPHLVLQALDDPLSTWRTNTADDPTSVLHPSNLFQVNAQENLVLLLTSTGGHVGWPVGWWPHSWVFMNDFVAAGFVVAWNEGLCVNASNIQ